jgi:hypothetical protein
VIDLVLMIIAILAGPADMCGAQAPTTTTVAKTGTVETAGAHESNPWAESARDVLVSQCGSCHRPGLSTSNPRALAIFNLHEPIWYKTMTDDQIRQLVGRTRNPDKFADADRKVIASFVACEVDKSCDAEVEEAGE